MAGCLLGSPTTFVSTIANEIYKLWHYGFCIPATISWIYGLFSSLTFFRKLEEQNYFHRTDAPSDLDNRVRSYIKTPGRKHRFQHWRNKRAE
jgi:hypothetical protein